MTGVFFVSLSYLERVEDIIWFKSKEVVATKLLALVTGWSLYEKLGFESSNEMVLLCE